MTAEEHIQGWASMGLEEVLSALAAFGLPCLRKMRRGWFCTITLPAGQDDSWECKSQFNHVTPLSAAHECAAAVCRRLNTKH